MLQTEIDEISNAFMDAWEEYFGQEMFYVPFDETVSSHPVYKDSKNKGYLFAQKKSFHGTFKEEPDEEMGTLAGKDVTIEATITFVTKELYDKGVTKIDERAVIQITDREGTTSIYNIVEKYGKVQLSTNKIFTKLGVVKIDE